MAQWPDNPGAVRVLGFNPSREDAKTLLELMVDPKSPYMVRTEASHALVGIRDPVVTQGLMTFVSSLPRASNDARVSYAINALSLSESPEALEFLKGVVVAGDAWPGDAPAGPVVLQCSYGDRDVVRRRINDARATLRLSLASDPISLLLSDASLRFQWPDALRDRIAERYSDDGPRRMLADGQFAPVHNYIYGLLVCRREKAGHR